MDDTHVPTVLHVLAPPAYGGLGRVVSALARGFQQRGRGVHVLAILDPGDGGNPLVRELNSAGVPTIVEEVPPRAYWAERAHVRRVVGAVGAHVVHTHGSRVDVVDAPVAHRMGRATVTTLHGFTGGGWKNRLYEWLQVRAARNRDAVVAVSRPMAAQVRAAGVSEDRLWTLPNAWSPAQIPVERSVARSRLELPADAYRIGWVGRLSHEKGPDVLVSALPLLSDLPVSVSFLGGGRQRGVLETLARDLDVASRITWHGAVEDSAQYMRAFDVFVLSSRTEGTPIALFEAIAADVPVVATAVGGVPDVVTEKEAMVVPSEDPAALAAAIREVYLNPERARSRSRTAAVRLTDQFRLEPWLDAYERIYCEAAERARRRNSR